MSQCRNLIQNASDKIPMAFNWLRINTTNVINMGFSHIATEVRRLFPTDLQVDSVCLSPLSCFKNICLDAHKQSPVFAASLGRGSWADTSHTGAISVLQSGKGKKKPAFQFPFLAFGTVDRSSNLAAVTDLHRLPRAPATTCITQAAFFEPPESVALNFHPFKVHTLFLSPINRRCLKFDREVRSLLQRRAARGTRCDTFSAYRLVVPWKISANVPVNLEGADKARGRHGPSGTSERTFRLLGATEGLQPFYMCCGRIFQSGD